MEIFLIRHAQCLSNTDGKFSYSTDEQDTLTQLGIEQARKTGFFLKSFWTKNSILVSSTLYRAKQTSELIKIEIGSQKPIFYDELLIEKSQLETFADVRNRVEQIICELKKNHQEIFIITHGHVIESLIYGDVIEFLISSGFKSSTALDIISPHNCGISFFSDNTLVTFNSTIHLFRKITIENY